MSEDFKQFYETALQGARDDLLGFCMLMNPNMVLAPHHRLIADLLMKSYEGDAPRCMIFMPPRSSKSWMASQHYPAWVIGHCPNWQFIVASHSADLAADWSREVRNLVDSETYQALFPNIRLQKDSKAAHKWNTNKGGVYIAAGAGGRIAGRGGNLVILDDAISEQDAYSKAERARLQRWYTSGPRQRLQPNGRIVIMNTRWHEDDISGWLLAKERTGGESWEILTIPAILDDEAAFKLEAAREKMIEQGLLHDNYPRMKAGETYWPRLPEYDKKQFVLAGWKTEELLTTKENLPPFEWQAAYMQSPVAEEGNILKVTYWKAWEHPNPPKCDYVLMSMDTAHSESDSADYSGWIVWGVFYNEESGKPNLIMLGAERGRWEYVELRRRTLEKYRELMPDAVIIEKASSGLSLISDLREAGIPVIEWPDSKWVGRDKIARAYACTPLFDSGVIWFPKGKTWAEDVMMECAAFPAGAHDDFVDMVTQAVLWIKGGQWVRNPNDDWQEEEDSAIMGSRKRYYYG